MPNITDDCTTVLGVRVNAIDMPGAVDACDRLIASGRAYVCVTGVHGVMEAQSDPELRSILEGSSLTVPDGMPMVWIGRLQGFSAIRRVYGPELMLEFCRRSVDRNHRHFLYGGNAGVADQLAENLKRHCPGLQIVGTFTPPFRPLTAGEESDLIELVDACTPDVIWVGLSTPKQERFMAEYVNRLNTKLMIGVGAAFDVHTGRIQDAPQWIKSSGLQWLHRLIQEPRRLWRRYLINNPLFLLRVTRQFLDFQRR